MGRVVSLVLSTGVEAARRLRFPKLASGWNLRRAFYVSQLAAAGVVVDRRAGSILVRRIWGTDGFARTVADLPSACGRSGSERIDES